MVSSSGGGGGGTSETVAKRTTNANELDPGNKFQSDSQREIDMLPLLNPNGCCWWWWWWLTLFCCAFIRFKLLLQSMEGGAARDAASHSDAVDV